MEQLWINAMDIKEADQNVAVDLAVNAASPLAIANTAYHSGGCEKNRNKNIYTTNKTPDNDNSKERNTIKMLHSNRRRSTRHHNEISCKHVWAQPYTF